jgi:hypothetical protein
MKRHDRLMNLSCTSLPGSPFIQLLSDPYSETNDPSSKFYAQSNSVLFMCGNHTDSMTVAAYYP